MTGCRMLRWKGFYADEWPAEVALAEAVARNDAPYSCLKTCQPFGPDDGPAAPETCGEERACWVPVRGARRS